MDYEKKYNEALERAKYVLHTVETAGCAMHKDLLTEIFPELRESEDERIRKWLADYFSSIKKTVWIHSDISCEQILAYLEKQKEQKPWKVGANAYFTPEQKSADLSDMMVHKEPYIAPVPTPMVADEPKPAEWSEEDEDMLNCCISSIEEAKENRYAYKETDGDTSYDREIAFLKSIRPSWKPSDNQMSMLRAIVNDPNNVGAESCHLAMQSLYNDLLKLK